MNGRHIRIGSLSLSTLLYLPYFRFYMIGLLFVFLFLSSFFLSSFFYLPFFIFLFLCLCFFHMGESMLTWRSLSAFPNNFLVFTVFLFSQFSCFQVRWVELWRLQGIVRYFDMEPCDAARGIGPERAYSGRPTGEITLVGANLLPFRGPGGRIGFHIDAARAPDAQSNRWEHFFCGTSKEEVEAWTNVLAHTIQTISQA